MRRPKDMGADRFVTVAEQYASRTGMFLYVRRKQRGVSRRVKSRKQWADAMRSSGEWFVVSAPNAQQAKDLVDEWPAAYKSDHARVVAHERKRL